MALPEEKRFMTRAALKPDGNLMGTRGPLVDGGTGKIWSLPDSLPGTPVADQLWAFAFSAKGRYTAIAKADGSVQVEENQRTLRTVSSTQLAGTVYALALSPDGELLATASSALRNDPLRAGPGESQDVKPASSQIVQVWAVSGGAPKVRFEYSGLIEALALSPNGKYLAVAVEGQVKIHLLKTLARRALHSIQCKGPVVSMDFDPTATFLAIAVGRGVELWNATTGKPDGRLVHGDVVNAVVFNPTDDSYLATASDDRNARVWEREPLREIVRIPHQDAVKAVAFSPDGKHLLTQSWGSTPRKLLWRREDLIEEACTLLLPRGLPLSEWQQHFPTSPFYTTCPLLPVSGE
jgi:WD40 repeat protein